MRISTALVAACVLASPSAWAQTEHKLDAREIFYAAPPAAGAPAKAAPQVRKTKPVQAKVARKEANAPAQVVPPASDRAPARQTSGDVPIVNASYAAGKPLGLRYSILKRTGAEMPEVDPASVFRAGDRIRLRVEVNDPGYLYIVNRGSSGNWKPLFPSAEVAGGDNRVLPGRSYDIPTGYTFTFDEQPGEEKLFVVFSRQPVQDLESLIYSLGDAHPTAAPAKKRDDNVPLLLAMARPIGDDLVGRMRDTYARDLIIEKVDESTPGPKKEFAVYAVNPAGSPDSRVVADVSLNHK